MHKPERSRSAALDQTWRDGAWQGSTETSTNAVSTLRVKLIGAHDEVRTQSGDGATRPYRSFSEHIPVNDTADDNVYWHDASSLLETADRSYQPMAFAHTMPDIPLDELGYEDSGVREIMRLQLWLHPRDAEQRAGMPTMRVNAAKRGVLSRAWQAWEQQSPGMTILTATVLCVVSALAVTLFAQ